MNNRNASRDLGLLDVDVALRPDMQFDKVFLLPLAGRREFRRHRREGARRGADFGRGGAVCEGGSCEVWAGSGGVCGVDWAVYRGSRRRWIAGERSVLLVRSACSGETRALLLRSRG